MSAPILPGIAPVADRYDGFILDLWGVLHDGQRALPGAVEALRELKARGKRIGLLSNAPRRCASVVAKLDSLAIPRDCYDFVLTSGEATHEALRDPTDAWHRALGPRVWHLGPERDADVLEGLPNREVVAGPEHADFVLNTGIDEPDEPLSMYEPALRAARAHRLPMICANPDLVVMIGDFQAICAGTLALRYEELGGEVVYHGKPHPGVYRQCFERLGLDDRSRIVAVGDSLRTDVAGANAAGIDVLFVTAGIHAEELGCRLGESPTAERLARLLVESPHRPTAVVPHFAW